MWQPKRRIVPMSMVFTHHALFSVWKKHTFMGSSWGLTRYSPPLGFKNRLDDLHQVTKQVASSQNGNVKCCGHEILTKTY
jgi:hypothetical protein